MIPRIVPKIEMSTQYIVFHYKWSFSVTVSVIEVVIVAVVTVAAPFVDVVVFLRVSINEIFYYEDNS